MRLGGMAHERDLSSADADYDRICYRRNPAAIFTPPRGQEGIPNDHLELCLCLDLVSLYIAFK